MVKIELDLSNLATKTDLKMQQELIHHFFAKLIDLANLKPDADKLDIDKSVTVLVDLSKLSDIVKNDVVKKCI